METSRPRPAASLVLVRLAGEVGIKARATRRRFVARLARNLRDALAAEGAPGTVHTSHDRIAVELAGEHPEAVPALARVFGVQSLSPAVRRPWAGLDDVVREGSALFADAVRGRRFAVRARRVGGGERVRLRPADVERALGAALLPLAARVDLGTPEFTARVELQPGEAFFCIDHVPGPGGLPLGVEGRALALLSGGFDSAVAAWQMLRRGVALDYVFCNLGGRTHQLGVLRVAMLLAERWSYGERPQLHALDFTAAAEELRARTARRYWQVLLKRMMLRAGELVAGERGASALVTGDAVGQVSSQTLPNLAVISRACELPILRPLAGMNKDEIVARSREIGTFELSRVVGEYCALGARRPATAAAREAVEAEEAHLDPSLLARAVASRRVLDLRHLDPALLELPDLDRSEAPPGATVVDLRSRDAHAAWHLPGALQLDFERALRAYPSFERGATYYLYCEIGLLSAHLAELMRKEGFRAYHAPGGVRPMLRRQAGGAPAGAPPRDSA